MSIDGVVKLYEKFTIGKRWYQIYANIWTAHLLMDVNNKKKLKKDSHSLAGNRTPVFRVTGGDTYHYTTKEEVVHK